MCTTFIVGDKATVDGSFLVARSADSSALKAQLFIIHPACYYPEGAMYRTKDHNGATDFSYPQPVHAMRYTSVPNWQTKLHGAVGFNEAGLGVTGTESIFARDDALAIDPYNKETGITQDDINSGRRLLRFRQSGPSASLRSERFRVQRQPRPDRLCHQTRLL